MHAPKEEIGMVAALCSHSCLPPLILRFAFPGGNQAGHVFAEGRFHNPARPYRLVRKEEGPILDTETSLILNDDLLIDQNELPSWRLLAQGNNLHFDQVEDLFLKAQ